ncbi:MAG: sulfotransferase domain-containing protein [Magnetococcales bacterium]|nr:sulfotransferase domain-containing protein [Magnetococcales bacterium]
MNQPCGIYWLSSYPKSGNTWLRIFIANLQDDRDKPIPINDIAVGGIASGRVWLDDVLGFDTADLLAEEVEILRPYVYRWSLQDPQIAYRKIHDAYTFTMEKQPLVSHEATLGAIYLLRNPLDVVLSAANHWNCAIDKAIEHMGNHNAQFSKSTTGMGDQVTQRILSWSDHVSSWVDAKNLNCLTIRYEDMLAHPQTTFTNIATFLQLPDDPQRVAKAIRYSSFQELRKQENEHGFQEAPASMQRFFRNGSSGNWRSSLTPEQVARLIHDHAAMMRRFGYLDEDNNPV